MSRRSAVTSLALALSAGLLVGSARPVHAHQISTNRGANRVNPASV